jgi:ATP-dependent Lon protease
MDKTLLNNEKTDANQDPIVYQAGTSDALSVLALRDVIVFPYMVMPLLVGRAKSIKAIEQAMKRPNKRILLVGQIDPTLEEPTIDNLYKIGTICSVLQLLSLPDGTAKILVEGQQRAKVSNFIDYNQCIGAEVEIVKTFETVTSETKVLRSLALSTFEEYLKLNKNLSEDVLMPISDIKTVGRLADAIAAHLPLKLEDKQDLLETFDGVKRLERLMVFLKASIEISEVEKRVSSRVDNQMREKQHRYYLVEKMEAIQKELGTSEEGGDEMKELERKIKRVGMPKEALKKAESELRRLKMMPPVSAEATVSRNYLDYLIAVPWVKASKLNKDLEKAEKILEADHYGLEKVKERILEYLAVQNRLEKLRDQNKTSSTLTKKSDTPSKSRLAKSVRGSGTILCFVGPPGVGKTSLGQSIARATGRKLVRMSLGGVRDEAEIRGHRRTYIGAFPGKIIQNLIKAGVRNPLFLLDEIDKVGMDYRGDPAAALLEVLDPEQNNSFNDHFLELDYDLSDVMFVATANTLDIIPALLDRLEVIALSGYTEDEKIHIAMKHLLKKQLKINALRESELKFSNETIQAIIRYYTREAGVRNLEREISKICRKVVRKLDTVKSKKALKLTPENLEDYLGVYQYRFGEVGKVDQVGQVTGLAWTEAGGEILTVEAVQMPGKGTAIITGQIGDVMQESIRAAMSVVKNRAQRLGINPDIFEKIDIHIHVPEGAIPKDGPSAGVTMCTALVSTLTNIPVFSNFAMTGEITLRGEVLPIGGLKEKLLAARRAAVANVIIPEENRKDLKEIPDNIKAEIKIHPVRWIDEVLELALVQKTSALPKKPVKRKSAKKKSISKKAKK